MKKKYIIVSILILAVASIVFININKKNRVSVNENKNIEDSDVPIKIEELEYNIGQLKNDKGEILIYLKLKNNSEKDIQSAAIDITDNKKLDVYIEYPDKIKSKSVSDNFYDIKNSNDSRTRIPIKDTTGSILKEVGDIKIKSYTYIIKLEDKEK